MERDELQHALAEGLKSSEKYCETQQDVRQYLNSVIDKNLFGVLTVMSIEPNGVGFNVRAAVVPVQPIHPIQATSDLPYRPGDLVDAPENLE